MNINLAPNQSSARPMQKVNTFSSSLKFGADKPDKVELSTADKAAKAQQEQDRKDAEAYRKLMAEEEKERAALFATALQMVAKRDADKRSRGRSDSLGHIPD